MAKKKKSTAPKKKDEESLSFEESLAALESIVDDLEEGSLGLEESLKNFEHGIRVMRRCYQILEQAEQRIEILTGLDEDGNALVAPFDASATIAQTQQTAGRRKQVRKVDAPPEADEADQPEDTDAGDKLF